MLKTLNEHLFDQLDRISGCGPDDIDLEINKTNAIIAVSEQILNVARLKIDIMQSHSLGHFPEIDTEPAGQTTEANDDDVVEEDDTEDYSKKKLAF